jgi:hypothetical protein
VPVVRRSRRAGGLVVGSVLLVAGAVAVGLLLSGEDDPARPDARTDASEPPTGWRTDGLLPAWRLGEGTAGFATGATPGQPRRAFRVPSGRRAVEAGAAVTWAWASSGPTARRSSGLLHTDPDGPATTGLRVEQLGDDIVLRDGEVALASREIREPVGAGHVGRLEVSGRRVRYLHDGQTLVDWTTWSGPATGAHGVFADDGGAPGPGAPKVDGLSLEVLPESGAQTVHLPYELDASGATDATGALNAFIARVPDGSTVRFPPGATVWSQSLEITDRAGLTIDLNGSTIHQREAPARNSVPVVRVWGGRDVTLRNGRIRGSNPAGPDAERGLRDRVHCHGVDYRGVDGIRQFDVDVSEVWGDFVYIGQRRTGPASAGPSSYVSSRDARVVGGRHSGSGRQGIAVISLEGGYIGGRSSRDRMVIDRVRRSSVDLEPLGYWERVSDVVLRHVEIGAGGLGVLAAAGAPPPTASELPPGSDLSTYDYRTVERVTVEDWYLPHRPFSGVIGSPRTGRRSDFSFRGILSLSDDGDRGSAAGALFTVWSVDRIRFDDIRQSFSGTTPMHFARLERCTGLVVGSGMDLRDTGSYGGDVLYNGTSVVGPHP